MVSPQGRKYARLGYGVLIICDAGTISWVVMMHKMASLKRNRIHKCKYQK